VTGLLTVNGNVSRDTFTVWQSVVIAVDNSTQKTATGLSRALCCTDAPTPVILLKAQTLSFTYCLVFTAGLLL